jgi:hypothetical protein
MQGAKYKAKNSTFKSTPKSATFSADIAGAYPEEAQVKTWIRYYTLNRGKNFIIGDKYELASKTKGITSSNLITYCKVTEVKKGVLKLEGEGFTINMSYNPSVVSPKVEFIEVRDRSLKRYWPNGVTRIKLEYINPGLKGVNTVVLTPEK